MSVDDALEEDDDTLVSGEPEATADEIAADVEDDGLDIDIVEEFNEDDFDEDFDDDFEEEIVGEYDLADDKYGQEFDTTFGHLTDPTRAKPTPGGKDGASTAAGKKAAAVKKAAEAKAKSAKKAAAKKTVAKPAKKPARKK